jgi:hypothetical protein
MAAGSVGHQHRSAIALALDSKRHDGHGLACGDCLGDNAPTQCSRPARTTSWLTALSAFVFPVPGGPNTNTFSRRSRKSPLNRPRYCCTTFAGSRLRSNAAQLFLQETVQIPRTGRVLGTEKDLGQ